MKLGGMSLHPHLHRTLRLHRGIMRSAELMRQGFSRHTLTREIAAGHLVRPQRGWIALPNASPELVYAAKHGVVLSCVSQAERLGLWVRARPRRTHAAVNNPNTTPRLFDGHLHRARPVRLRTPWQLEDSVENVLALVAQCQPHEDTLATWESAFKKRLVTRTHLERFPFRGPALRLLREATPYSDSGLETYVRVRLRWLPAPITAQAWILGHRVDFLIGKRLILQVDGGHHVGDQRDSDNRHDALLALRGYTVIRVGYRQVMDQWPEVQRLVMDAVSQGRHAA